MKNLNRNIKRVVHILVLTMLLACMLPTAAFAASKTTPGKVTLSKTSATAYNKVKVSWKKATGVSKYYIYYRKDGASKWTKIASVASSKTSYTHTSSKKYPIVVGQKYNYTVRAYNSKSKKLGKYNTKGLTVKTVPGTVKLKNIALNSGKTAVTISWKKAAGCDKYRVYRKTPSSGYETIATVKSGVLSYTDKSPVKGVKNTYTVRAYYSKTKALGGYNKTGLSVNVPASSTSSGTSSSTSVSQGQDDSGEETSSTEAETDKTVTEPQYSNEELARQVFELVNQERVKAGCSPLIYHENMEKAAMVRAQEITVRFAHWRPNDSHFYTALREAGVALADEGENIAYGYKTPEAVMAGWMNSEGHRSNILYADFRYIGIGHYKDSNGKNYWVQVFTTGDPDRKCTLTFDANGGTINGESTYVMLVTFGQFTYGKDMPVPQREGYSFIGWSSFNSSVIFGKDADDIAYSCQLDLTFQAYWEKLP